MAVLSPALVVAMCVMFVLTRLHRHYYIFEQPFLFGLKYCLEPDRAQLAAIAKASSTSKTGSSGNATKKKGKQSNSKPKITVAALAVRRGKLDESFFPENADFPHHRELDHLMAICCGYLAAYLFEDILSCFYPNLFANRRSIYVALFGVGFATFQAWKISVTLTSMRMMLMVLGAAWLIALFVLSAGDYTNFIKFDQAFSALKTTVTDILGDKFGMEEAIASKYAWRVAMFSRLLVASAAAFIAASSAVPARRFSKLDYGLHLQYRQDDATMQEDPYTLGRPTAFTMLKIALDYVLPFLTAFLWTVSPRGTESYGAWRILSLISCVVVRFASLRMRLQAYLDGAIDAYRKFWVEKTASNTMEAGRMTSFQVIGTSYYLIMIAMAYVAPACMPLLFALVAKLDGGICSGLCPTKTNEMTHSFELFAREVAGFLSWWTLTSYTAFATMSLIVEFLLDIIDPGARDQGGKLPVPTSSSEKRRQKRMMQEQMMRSRTVHRNDAT